MTAHIYERLGRLIGLWPPGLYGYQSQRVGLQNPEVVAQLTASGPGPEATVYRGTLSYGPVQPNTLGLFTRSPLPGHDPQLLAQDDGRGNLGGGPTAFGLYDGSEPMVEGTINYRTREWELTYRGPVAALLLAAYSYEVLGDTPGTLWATST